MNTLQEIFKFYLEKYVTNPLFQYHKELTPYHRALRAADLLSTDFEKPLSFNELTSNEYLQAHRVLLNIYEQDLVFLPRNNTNSWDMLSFKEFYHDDLKQAGEFIRPKLESYVFKFLNQEIEVEGVWDINKFEEYTSQVLNEIRTSESQLFHNITSSKNPQRAARFFIAQCAGDFLTEASAMGRNVLGNFGQETSELFKIFIDEYGYGVHSKKHSTLFENMCDALNMSADIHTYWQYYLPSSLALINYFHYVSKNHAHFFKYIGALYFTEAALAFTTVSQSAMMKSVFGDKFNTQYFDEHTHIDVHHGRMALEKLIKPLVKKFGNQVISEMLLGFEQFRMLQDLADEELFKHVIFHDQLDHIAPSSENGYKGMSKLNTFYESKGLVSISHIHPVDEFFVVDKGTVELTFSPAVNLTLNEGEGIMLKKGILHGSKVLSTDATYSVYMLTDEVVTQ
ncbi:iron-containing redox enzyme family protein [Facilibium subflavum]|uniref:iron-containing redox enzyme family protein n=1 Tax=Facilibium subflavum TaxID=2219058 RepID=UPI000E646CDF|nr:iron-containing redox enzyme family protein [Facilibium subflavum]